MTWGASGRVPAVRIAMTEREVREAARLIRDHLAAGHIGTVRSYLAGFTAWDRPRSA